MPVYTPSYARNPGMSILAIRIVWATYNYYYMMRIGGRGPSSTNDLRGGVKMAKRQQWEWLKFDTEEEVIRAIRVRSGLEGVTQAEVINAALRSHLAKEIAEVRGRMR